METLVYNVIPTLKNRYNFSTGWTKSITLSAQMNYYGWSGKDYGTPVINRCSLAESPWVRFHDYLITLSREYLQLIENSIFRD